MGHTTTTGNLQLVYCLLPIVCFNSGAYSFRLSVAADSTKAGNGLVGKRGCGGNRKGNIFFEAVRETNCCEYFIAHLQAADNLLVSKLHLTSFHRKSGT